MSSASKRKGSGAERDVVAWLKANGYKYADRRLAGATLDKGDISGIPGVTIEIKEPRQDGLSRMASRIRNRNEE
jgi:Holliday junction resolvase